MAFAACPVPRLDRFASDWLRDNGLAPADLLEITNADQFLALGSRLPPTAQLVDGEVVIQSSPSVRHQHVVKMLVVALEGWLRASSGRGQVGLGVDTKVDDRNVYTPDLWWCCEFRKPGLEGTVLDRVPDLVVEVLSRSTRRYDLKAKRVCYEERGVVEYGVIDPNRRCGVLWRRSRPTSEGFDLSFDLSEHDDLTSPLLPGFRTRLGEVLGEPP